MVDFSGKAGARGFNAPTRFEADVYDCEVFGQVPRELDGVFYRLHGEWLYPPKDPAEPYLSADGYISMFRIKDGHADYRGRFVRTGRLENEIKAGRRLYGCYRNPFDDDVSVRDPERPHLRTVANTSPVILAGRLYATKEDGLPHEIDPNTLETIGPTDFDGTWKSQTFIAHPKRDPVSGETVAFGYEASGLASRDSFLATFDRSGVITHATRFELPYVSMIHDMAITQSHVIIPGGGFVTSMDYIKAGKPHWGWDSTLPSFYGVIPRGADGQEIRWFYGPERVTMHTANAWSEGDKVILEAPLGEGNYWPFFPDIHGAAFEPRPQLIRRLTFDLGSKDDRVQEEILVSTPVTSFTRIDDRRLSLPYRHVYVQFADPDRPYDAKRAGDPGGAINNCFGRFDLRDRTMSAYFAGETCVVQEPSFAPRPGSVDEGDGYLIGTAHNLAERRSELVILDAPSMSELARIILPFRNGPQVHGVWASAADLPLA
jgi:carotenoid cleavage dioxygenase-like enzyme